MRKIEKSDKPDNHTIYPLNVSGLAFGVNTPFWDNVFGEKLSSNYKTVNKNQLNRHCEPFVVVIGVGKGVVVSFG
ncbi:hypothetical protein [Cyclobacterium plantarum]|uniref:Uncharacterized protein n=1 Tax=Cyclobacterium plantarum TaxID=2716263 RepID=A0ABX0HDL4_9BACT|nr:hypothetical protein [Cyclobacterium plantarum]NHE58428.1 hypothetical protein [Cyclobacterium plantarum]